MLLRLWDRIKAGYLQVVDPLAQWLVRRGIGPNAITTVGTLTYIAGGAIYATGHIRPPACSSGSPPSSTCSTARSPRERAHDRLRRLLRLDARPGR
jgi:hypothetical protein